MGGGGGGGGDFLFEGGTLVDGGYGGRAAGGVVGAGRVEGRGEVCIANALGTKLRFLLGGISLFVFVFWIFYFCFFFSFSIFDFKLLDYKKKKAHWSSLGGRRSYPPSPVDKIVCRPYK